MRPTRMYLDKQLAMLRILGPGGSSELAKDLLAYFEKWCPEKITEYK